MSYRERELQPFYEATYRRLVGVIGAVHGDAGEAEDAVQEAFVRLLGHWSSVSRYDDPEAWVRKVALRICRNKQRKLGNGVEALGRHGAPAPVPAPDADAVDISRALARLPRGQREVVVLHHLGLDHAAVAEELGIPPGTVKSRLSRARSALATTLREADDHVRS